MMAEINLEFLKYLKLGDHLITGSTDLDIAQTQLVDHP